MQPLPFTVGPDYTFFFSLSIHNSVRLSGERRYVNQFDVTASLVGKQIFGENKRSTKAQMAYLGTVAAHQNVKSSLVASSDCDITTYYQLLSLDEQKKLYKIRLKFERKFRNHKPKKNAH